jgi:hypothetical protein
MLPSYGYICRKAKLKNDRSRSLPRRSRAPYQEPRMDSEGRGEYTPPRLIIPGTKIVPTRDEFYPPLAATEHSLRGG